MKHNCRACTEPHHCDCICDTCIKERAKLDPNPDKTRIELNMLIRIINSKPDVMDALNDTLAILQDNYDENKHIIMGLLNFKYDLQGM